MDHVQELIALRSQIDQEIESGLVAHEDVSGVLRRVLGSLRQALQASCTFVYTYEEDARLHMHAFPAEPNAVLRDLALVECNEAHGRRVNHVQGADRLIAQPLDIGGTWFGIAGIVLPETIDAAFAATALEQTSEVLDNYLFGIYSAKQKQHTMLKLGHALRNRVFSLGLDEAVRILVEATPLRDLVLVYRTQEAAESTLQVEAFRDGVRQPNMALSQADAAAYLEHGETALLTQLGLDSAQEEVLINGITRSVVVGKLVATSKKGTFNMYDRDVLANFAGFVRQRIVDFNKEWRTLAASFRAADVAELLAHDNYRAAFLEPREETVAVLYVDIAGFTRISEQILRTPSHVAKLVEAWSREVVDTVWKYGGVFDKMVGDCVIGLFGPPFYRNTPGQRLANALDAVLEIRDLTAAFGNKPEFEVLRDAGLAVSTGVNLTQLFVGLFGPNENFTGFSSGMNNTARLQGCAKAGEILVMDDAITALPSGTFTFGPEGSAAVKNVAEPLRFRPLLQRNHG